MLMDLHDAPYEKEKMVCLVGEEPLIHFPGEPPHLTWWVCLLDLAARTEVQCARTSELQVQKQDMIPVTRDPQIPILFLHSTAATPVTI